MAIYHLHAQVLTRSEGENAIASAAYRRAAKLFDEKEKKSFDYTKKPDVIHSELLIPDNSPEWVSNLLKLHETNPDAAANRLWNLVEASEKRKDSQLAREIEFSLPIELDQEQCIALAREFIKDQFVSRGMIADWNVHWDKGNPHVHVMLTMRQLTEQGFGLKVREWNRKSFLKEWRRQWAEYANFHLRLHQHDVRIDHRSYADQGIDLIPTIHQGKAVRDMNARGIDTAIMDESNSIKRENLSRITAKPEILLNKLSSHSPTFTQAEINQELGRYAHDQEGFSIQEKGILSEFLLNDFDEANPVLNIEEISKVINSIEQHESVFKERDIAKAVEPYANHPEAFAQALIQVKSSNELIYLGVGDDGRDRFTTRRMFEIENDIQKYADMMRSRSHRKISKRQIDKILDARMKQLTPEQLVAVKHILAPSAISCVVGRAGTGKSFLLGAARAVWEEQGFRVHGIALSGIAADGLNKDGINSRTIESFCYALSKGQIFLSDQDIVVMDEAGMTDSVSMLAVLKAVEAAKAKLVLVGDHAQLQPVGPGASFRALIERLSFREIQTIYRQEAQWQRDATIAFATGHIAEGLSAYEAKNCIHFEKTTDATVSRLVNDWFAARALHGKALSQYLVVTHRNEDVRLLNRLLREQRVARNEIAEGYLVNTRHGKIKIAQDDRILFLKNDRHLGVNNGRFATVKSVNLTESGQVLDFTVILDGSDKEVLINPSRYSDFTYGYAATVHKVQGMTVDHSFIYAGGSSWNRHLTYVALTRHKYTAHLYANQETHKDFNTLHRHLSRYGIKDSLLDFPLAFAERRGIDTEGLLKLLPQHLAKRLATLKEKVATQIEQFVDPIGFSKRCEDQLNQQLKDEKIAQRRQDAKLVAAYVDVNCEVGVNWQALQTRLHALGLDNISYEAEVFSLISDTKEYIAFQSALQEREVKAFQIVKELPRYELAVDIYNLDLNKLRKQAEQYTYRQRVEQYLQEQQRGAVIHRDRIAAEMMPAIKQHYSYLKKAGVIGKEIKQYSIAHLRRQFFTTLTPEERNAFRVVERYQLLARQIGEQWSTQMGDAETMVKRSKIKCLNKLSLERDQLASKILCDRQYYDKALDFYQIGIAVPHFGEKPAEKDRHQAETRWYKLQQQAARYELQRRVETYHSALLKSDLSTRLRLAHEIKQDTKAHHGAILGLGEDTKEIWFTICQDAKRYDRHQHYQQLDLIERIGFKAVEAYVEAKRAHGHAWRELLMNKESAKETADFDEKVFYAQLIPYATKYTQLRNQLAAGLTENPLHYQAGLDYFKIKIDELKPQAYSHQCRMNVENYSQAHDPLMRSQHALAIIADPKAHHGAIIEKKIKWRDIYQASRIAERKILFTNLSHDEKAVYRLADRYRKANQKAGKIFSEFKKRSLDKNLSTEKNNIDILFAKRDYLAWRLVNAAQAIDVNFLNEFAASHHLKIDKLVQQHAKQEERLTYVESWQSAYLKTIETARAIYPHLDASPEFISDGLKKTFSAIEHTMHLQKAYRLNQNTFNYALQAKGLCSEEFDKKIKGVQDLKAHFQSLVTLKNLDKKDLIEKPKANINKSLPIANNTYRRIDIKRLREDLNARAEEVTQHYLGQPKTRHGNAWRYGSNHGSLIVNVGGSKQGLWRDFQLGVGGDMLNLIQQAMETTHFKAILEEGTRFLGGCSYYEQPAPLNRNPASIERSKDLDHYTLKKIQKAQAIFQATGPIAGTLAERYLREHRHIEVSLDDKTLRYHPNLRNWMTGDTFPALVIAARDEKESVCGIQAIFLDSITGKKASLGQHTKLSRGLIGEGALVNKGVSTGKVAFAEGVETALSVASAHPDWKIYTTFGVSNFDKVPLKSKSLDILLCADNDGPDSGTAKSVERAANILANQGINVWLVEPQKPDSQKKWDFNDALVKEGISRVRTDLDSAILHKKGITRDSIAENISQALERLGGFNQKNKHPYENKNTEKVVTITQTIEFSKEQKRALEIEERCLQLERLMSQSRFAHNEKRILANYAKELNRSPQIMSDLKARNPELVKRVLAIEKAHERNLERDIG